MSYEAVKDFRLGLDARKFYLSAPVGSLTTAINCHVTQGGELEKRKEFVPVPVPSPYAGRVYGIQPSPDGIYLFGAYSIIAPTFERSRTANVATIYVPRGTIAAVGIIVGTHINVSGMSGTGYNVTNVVVSNTFDDGIYLQVSYPSTGADELLTADFNGRLIRTSDVIAAPFIYQVIYHPAIAASGAGSLMPVMDGIVYSTLFGRYPFVLAHFTDGAVIPYYNGIYLKDAALGLEFFGTDAAGNALLDAINNYIASNITAYTSTETAGTLDIFSVPTTLNGTPYTVDVDFTSTGGAIAPAQQTTGQASVAASQAVGSFQIVNAGSGTQATGTLTNTSDGNLSDGDTVTIGSITYRFKNTMAQAYDVKIGAGHAITLASFAAAINGTGIVGTDYFTGTLPNPSVKCGALNITSLHYTLSLYAITGGAAGNSLALSSTASTRLQASGATLSGGVDSQITQIVINGATNLLLSAVPFTTDVTTTAAAVVSGINANVASGYQATSNGGSITILAQVVGIAANGFTVQVQSQGSIVCGTGAFTLTGSGFTLDFCKANGVDLMNDAILLANEIVMTYPQVPGQVLSDFCRLVANNINSATSTTGYIAFCAQGSVSVYISKAIVSSTDKQQVLDVGVTPSVGQTGAVIPVTVVPLVAILDTNAVAIPIGVKSDPVTVTAQGGVAPFTYNWIQQGQNAIGVIANHAKDAQTTFSSAANNIIKQQLQIYNRLQTSDARNAYLANHPALQAYLAATQTNQVAFVCIVTDAIGEQATSDAVYITLLGR